MTSTTVVNDAWIEAIPASTTDIDSRGRVQPVNVTINAYASNIKLIKLTYPETAEVRYQLQVDGYGGQTLLMTETNFNALAALIKSSIDGE